MWTELCFTKLNFYCSDLSILELESCCRLACLTNRREAAKFVRMSLQSRRTVDVFLYSYFARLSEVGLQGEAETLLRAI